MGKPGSLSANGNAAVKWFEFGYPVIPLKAGEKFPAVSWDDWLADLSPRKIRRYWLAHPNADLGAILGPNIMVLDADSPQSLEALERIEAAHNVRPRLTVKTKKGEHHHHGLAPGTFARISTFSTDKFPERIDVKTGRSYVILPPSTDKTLLINEAHSASELSVVDQDFVDAIFQHNNRQPPRPSPVEPEPVSPPDIVDEYYLALPSSNLPVLIRSIDPDENYDLWVEIGMILYNETGGSEEGLRIYDNWSARGPKYPGSASIRNKWNSFGHYQGKPKTLGTLLWRLKARNLNWMALLAEAEPGFEVVDPGDEALPPEATPGDARPADPAAAQGPEALPAATPNPLARFSITGSHATLSENSRGVKPVLGRLAMWGQYTTLFAAPNAGKTLLMMHLIERAVTEGHVDPTHVYYINADDNETGMLEKLALAEEWGIQMLVPGFKKFALRQLPDLLAAIRHSGLAAKTVIILDTLKKATSTNDKSKIAAFNQHIPHLLYPGWHFCRAASRQQASRR